MWLSIILSIFVVFVTWAEPKDANVTVHDDDIYKLKVWTRDPKYESQRKSNVNFRSGKRMKAIHPSDDRSRKEDASSVRRLRLPLKERIHERVYGDKARSKRIRNEERDNDHHSKRIRNEERDNDHHLSTRITPMKLVEQSTSVPHQNKKGSSKEKDKPLDEDKKDTDSGEFLERLSVYSMKQTMKDIAKQYGKETNTTVNVLGRTFEYNDIVILKMSERKSDISKYFRANDDAKYIDDAPEKKIIFIVHGLVTMGIQDLPCLSTHKRFTTLIKFYMEHLDKFDIFLIPMANPDGFAKTFATPYWNKNTSPQSTCQGVNLDRNFDVAWSEAAPVQPCSQYYPGPSPFSEPETKAVREVLHRYSHKIAAYINVHAGTFATNTFKGEAVLYPKGFTEAQTDDDKYMDLKGEIDEIMRNASFQRAMVTVDTLNHWYGKVTGTSVDYAATVFGVPFAMEFVMETYNGDDAQLAALTAIWKRVIDAIFTFIHKKGEIFNDV